MSEESNRQILEKEQAAFATAARIKYYDIVIDHGHGAIITDVEGNDYIDLLASASSTNTGHAHPRIVKAIQEQAAKIIQYTPAYFANSQAARLAPRLAALAPMSGPVEVAWGTLAQMLTMPSLNLPGLTPVDLTWFPSQEPITGRPMVP